MLAKTATLALPNFKVTRSTSEQIANQQLTTKMYNDSYNSCIIKSGILELCHLVHRNSSNGSTIKELVGEQVLVTIYRTCGEYFAVINLLNETNGQQLNNSSIQNMNELSSICINLKHSKIEKCNNAQFFKLVLNDFTSVILFRVVKRKEQTHLQTPQQSINNQQSKSLGDLSVINEVDNEDNQKDIQNNQTSSWIKAFSENHRSVEGDHLLRANNLSPLTRRQSLKKSLQTVIESDEEEEEQQYHSLY